MVLPPKRWTRYPCQTCQKEISWPGKCHPCLLKENEALKAEIKELKEGIPIEKADKKLDYFATGKTFRRGSRGAYIKFDANGIAYEPSNGETFYPDRLYPFPSYSSEKQEGSL